MALAVVGSTTKKRTGEKKTVLRNDMTPPVGAFDMGRVGAGWNPEIGVGPRKTWEGYGDISRGNFSIWGATHPREGQGTIN